MEAHQHHHQNSRRKSHHPEKLKANLVSRLNRIEGQIRGIKRMIEEDTYCDNILNLVASVQSALGGAGSMLVEHHLKSCVVDQIREGHPEVIEEFMTTIKKLQK